ncbi:CD276 antigen-like [Mustelus asterias]
MNISIQFRQNRLTLLSLLCSVCAGPALAVTVAQVGQDVLLRCQFNVAPLKGLIIEWSLREPELRVAYSYHNGNANFRNQHQQFRNRTVLDESQLALGHAFLKIRRVSPWDEGPYGCYVRSSLGRHEERQELQVAAPYSEPEVSCFPVPPLVNLSCRSEGGYPLSQLQWQWANGSGYPRDRKSRWAATEDGTYELHSWVEVPEGLQWQLECAVTNARLNQSVASGQGCGSEESSTNGTLCPSECRQVAGRQETRSRLAIIWSVVNLLLLLGLLTCVQNCPAVKLPV